MRTAYFVKASNAAAPQAGTVATTLQAAGFAADTPVTLVDWAAVMRACRVRTTLGTLDREAAQDGTSPALVLVGEIPEAVMPPVAAAEAGDDEGDAFLAYGRSWFR